MKMKDVIISVTGIQHGKNGPDALQLVTAGQYGVEHDQICMTWEESELTGRAGAREGEQNTSMEFEQGKKHYFLYETPFGSATMGLNTRRIRSSLGLHGGDMEIEYTVDVDQTIVGRNRFYIQVQEPKESHTGDIRWPI